MSLTLTDVNKGKQSSDLIIDTSDEVKFVKYIHYNYFLHGGTFDIFDIFK